MKKFLKTRREIIALALFFGVVGLLGFLVVMPLLAKIAEIKNGIEQGIIKQNIGNQRLTELPKIRQQYEEMNSQQEKIDILLDKQQVVTLIERLEKLAQDTNNIIAISIKDNSQQKVVPAPSGNKTASTTENALLNSLPNKDYLQLTISLTGDYSGLYKFIASLESLEYYSDILSVSISHLVGSDVSGNATNSVVTNGGNGSLNPFNSQVGTSPSVFPVSLKKNGNKLSTSLQVAFYSKK